MEFKAGAMCAALAISLLTASVFAAETSHQTAVKRPAATKAISRTAAKATAKAKPEMPGIVAKSPVIKENNKENDEDRTPENPPQPQVIVTNPAPAPPFWTLHERILWAAQLVLVVLAYAGIMLAISILKKIERQTRYAETAAEAAATSAQAALSNAQAVIRSERPWILVTVSAIQEEENSFRILATNRGRAPASIVTTTQRALIAVDEEHLPASPEYADKKPDTPLMPIILLPGDTAPLAVFRRGDVRGICNSEEEFKRLEDWEARLFLYGKVVYRNLTAPADGPLHETNWCCWHIHGRQNSGLVIAGPASYNQHT